VTSTETIPSLAGASAFPQQVESVPSTGGKRILLAAPRGYCAGVDRAVDAVEKALDLYGAPVYVRKEIVHNKFVVETLTRRGAIFVNETDEVPEGARVVFSAHGVSPAVHAQAAARNLATIDATCPLVTKVHKEAVRFAKDDYDILLIGHDGHEEVEGTQGEAPDHIQVVNGPEEVDKVQVRDPDRLIWISQTTLSVDETMETVDKLRERFPNLQDPPSDDICYATQNRQVAVKKLAPDADVVIVVGSANSSNSVRLVEVALDAGAGSSYRVDTADEIDPEWLRDVVGRLQGLGFGEVVEVRTATEDILFSLPKNLRADLKASGAVVDRPHKAREAAGGRGV
jgi:4-hydroxy-3-methylbut-2-enyl diphosphate reductase